ncbi:MAG TPA: hypothetical protein VHM19_20525 [Polyangiales bacterium]|jgi:hypothetical protein|nr:hypothetical protein [Polyangiales bacterium]
MANPATPSARYRNASRIFDVPSPAKQETGVEMRRFEGDLPWPASFLEARLELGARFVYEALGEHILFFYVLSGEVSVGSDAQRIREAQIAWFDACEPGPTGVEVFAAAESHLIAFTSRPPTRA